ncbi:hypothetical protein [Pontibacter burrus]|uniref:DUF4352 domain-containing protein n=1 Tax=Pontibacter burrus TaxID=2704466 RepID=A0A6B3LV41_9BACT|nr:hypothetical protein [Pontibacter burrus]NEM97417.1 hypothetical protein [Pontibacter burrus]
MTQKFSTCFLVILLISVINVNAQVKLSISEIVLSNYKIISNKNIVSNKHDTDGPYALIYCKLTNESNSNVILNPSSSNIYLTYNLKGVTYKKELIAMPFVDQNKICLREKEEASFSAGDHLLLSTSLLAEYENVGFNEILLQILPTIRVVYNEEDNGLSISSDLIEKVTLKK